MMCAIEAGRRWRSVCILEHMPKIGGKLWISGGGRCNFTNRGAGPGNYVSRNPHFCKSALSRFPSQKFVERVEAHRIPYHERKHQQLFCDESAGDLVRMLKQECDEANVEFRLGCRAERVERPESGEGGEDTPRFAIHTSQGVLTCRSLVIASGGLSIPKVGSTGWGYEVARQFGLKVTDLAPALDGLTFSPEDTAFFKQFAGISFDVGLSCNGIRFVEKLLFTHMGVSGPVSLQISLHWRKGDAVDFDLLPGVDALGHFLARKREGSRALVRTVLAELLPARFADVFCDRYFPEQYATLPLPQVSEKAIAEFCALLHKWTLTPAGTVGYNKAEVTRGGIDTDELSSKTMEAKKVPGLYFIGEVVDVTGWLGGFNYQWAWASGWAAGQVV